MHVAEAPAIAGCLHAGKNSEAADRIREAISACSKDEDVRPLKLVKVRQIQA